MNLETFKSHRIVELQENLEIIHFIVFLTLLDRELFTRSHNNLTSKKLLLIS
jgi:hypothetical protein